MKANLRVLSLGAGVQSSTLALMIAKGKIPMVDCAIFADTMGEPKAVYEWLSWLEKQLNYPVYKVSKGNLRKDMIDAIDGKYKFLSVPLYTKNAETGKKGLLFRQCTADYKILPVNKKVRELLGLELNEKRKKGTKVEMLMGISMDEVYRVKVNRLKYITNVYPLIELGMNRNDCLNWIKQNNYPTPPRSACTFCPFHSNFEWRKIKENKEEWEKVVELDSLVRKGTKKNTDELFLHKSCVPIDQVDLTEKPEDQYNLFNNECEGMCGV
jgi:3'-phosphoadenosine 5'-phosphosulfate sulfotransferase (PAPS reductase)/FAD synthetase